MPNEDFLTNYFDYATGNEVPDIFHKWAGISALSMCAGRRFWLEFSPDYVLYPHMYILLIAAAGGRKTSAMSPAKSILRDVGEIPICGDTITKEALCKEMSADDYEGIRTFKDPETLRISKFTQTCIFANEWVHFIATNPIGMLDFFTAVWDQPFYDGRTKNMGNDFFVGPTVPILGCLTTDIMTSQLKTDLISGGFIRRCCMIHSDDRGTPVAFPTKSTTQHAARERAVKRAKYVAHSDRFCGKIEWGEGAIPWYDEWYKAQFHEHEKVVNPLLRGYYNARHDLMLKVAMLLSLSDGTKTLEVKILKTAIEYIEGYEKHLPKVFEGAGRNEHAMVATQILERLRTHGKLPKKKLLREMFGHANAAELAGIIEHLTSTDQIVPVGEQGKPVYLMTREDYEKTLKT
tara:strand:+ start:923 stop:2137 length:1215 start_codon:yes stop_codon:yes gene_type:complete